MTETALGDTHAAPGPITGSHLHEAIGRRVLLAQGRPPDLIRVQVRLLWANRFRVNVITGDSVTAPRIEGSYFVEADQAGNVLHSSPALAPRR
jgi:hypothetical protein